MIATLPVPLRKQFFPEEEKRGYYVYLHTQVNYLQKSIK